MIYFLIGMSLAIALLSHVRAYRLEKKLAIIADTAAKGIAANTNECLRLKRSLSRSQTEIYTNLTCEACGELLPVGSVRTHTGRWLCPKHKAA